jgi:YggT family protein
VLPADFFLTIGVRVLNEIISLIVDTAATVLAAAFLLRFWTQAVRVRPPEPVVRFILKLSNWFVLPIRRILPGFGGYDWASLIGVMLLAVVAVLPAILGTPHFGTKFVLLASTQQVLNWVFYGFMGLLVFEALFSWINPHAPMAPFIAALNEPLLRPIRRHIPSVGGLDLSVLIALVLLRVVLMLLSSALVSLI